MTAPFNARIHGNGFLQLDLPGGDRLHLWDERLPRQRVNTAIHNHRFSFESTVLCGTLLNVELGWQVCNSDLATHRFYTVKRDFSSENTVLQPTAWLIRIVADDCRLVHPCQSYKVAAGALHLTAHLGTTVTRMTKHSVDHHMEPMVACRVGELPDNEFHRDLAPIPGWAWDVLAPYLPSEIKEAA